MSELIGRRPAHPALLQRLLWAHREQQAIELTANERPRDLDEAYATAHALVEALGLETGGAKVGANGPEGQRMLGLAEPLWGHVLAQRCWAGEAEFAIGDAGVSVEVEWVITLNRDLDGEGAHDRDTVRAAIAELALGIEINRPSYSDPMREGGLAIIADNGVHAGLVLGRSRHPRVAPLLLDLPVWLAVDVQAPRTGSAAGVGVDPVEALIWVASDRARRSVPLRRGHRIATGALLTCRDLHKGSTVRAGGDSGAECTLVLI